MDRLESISALAGEYKTGEYGATSENPLVLSEKRGLSMVQLAVFDTTAVSSYLQDQAGLELPAAGSSTHNEKSTVLWIGPDRFLAVSQGKSVLDTNEPGLPVEQGALQDLGSARSIINLAGQHARQVLAKGLTVKVDAQSCTPGQVMLSSFDHHFHAIIHNVTSEQPAYDIYITRSFALSFWEWLCDASLEFGYRIDSPTE